MPRTRIHGVVALTVATLASLAALVPTHPAQAVSPGIVISEIYGGGGNAGSELKNDFIELFNRADRPVDVTGWSVQYTSASGTRWQATPLTGTIEPGEHYLVKQAGGSGGTEPLPAPDASGSIALSATSGKVALVTSAGRLACGTSCAGALEVMDFVGYGSTASEFEGSAPVGTLSNTEAARRISSGCIDTDDNAADFAIRVPNPKNTSAEPAPCSARADLSLDMVSSTAEAQTGGRFRYILTIGNAGPATATGVTVDNTLPDGLVLETATPEGACTETSGTVTCSLGALPVNGSMSVSLYVSPTAAGDVTNTASVGASEPDPTPASAEARTSIVGPDCVTIGTPGNDVIEGTDGADAICALGGEDRIFAGHGADWVATGNGHDRAQGGSGDDVLEGWSGADQLNGGGGADRLFGGEQGDSLEARDGVSGNDTVNGGQANDKCYADTGDILNACP